MSGFNDSYNNQQHQPTSVTSQHCKQQYFSNSKNETEKHEMILNDVSSLSKKSRKRLYNKWYYQRNKEKESKDLCTDEKKIKLDANQYNEEMTKVDNKVDLRKQNKNSQPALLSKKENASIREINENQF